MEFGLIKIYLKEEKLGLCNNFKYILFLKG